MNQTEPYIFASKERAERGDRIVAREIKGSRVSRGISESELACACGLSSGDIIRYESGRHPVPASSLFRLAGYLELDIDVILGMDTVEDNAQTNEALCMQ